MDHPEYNRTAVVIPIETNKWIVGPLHSISDSCLNVVTLIALMPSWAVRMLVWFALLSTPDAGLTSMVAWPSSVCIA